MLKNLLKKIGIILLELLLIGGALWFIAQKRGIENFSQISSNLQKKIEKPIKEGPFFPELGQPISRIFNWEYRNNKYELELEMDSAAYEYYKLQPKSYSYSETLPENWEDEYYGMFLHFDPGDYSMQKLAAKLEELGKKQKLSEDQLVELVLAFVQSIEYDDDKAKNILDKAGKELMLRPYELLFEQKGVCSDKSLLTIAILRQLGYGAAAFIYPEQNHMAVGIQCPQAYSTYGSGYCYGETTAIGNRIGIIPSIDSASNKTVVVGELENMNSDQLQKINLQQLGKVNIIQKTSGKQYSGIIQTKKISDEIDVLKKNSESMLRELQVRQKLLTDQQEQLKELEVELKKEQESENVEKYNALVKKYNDLLEIYKKNAKKYNNNAELYNKTIARYNILIKQ